MASRVMRVFKAEELESVARLAEEICDYVERCRTGLQLEGAIREGVHYKLREKILPLMGREVES